MTRFRLAAAIITLTLVYFLAALTTRLKRGRNIPLEGCPRSAAH
jgi:hypothetical protein